VQITFHPYWFLSSLSLEVKNVLIKDHDVSTSSDVILIPPWITSKFIPSLNWKPLGLQHRIFDTVQFFRPSEKIRRLLKKLIGKMLSFIPDANFFFVNIFYYTKLDGKASLESGKFDLSRKQLFLEKCALLKSAPEHKTFRLILDQLHIELLLQFDTVYPLDIYECLMTR
jgi:hypothetical protein